MLQTTLKRSFLILICLFIFACGGGGGSVVVENEITKEDLIGTYNLKNFKISYNNGNILRETTSNVKTFFGSIRIKSDDTFSQFIQIDKIVMYTTGSYAITENNQLKLTFPDQSYNILLSLSTDSLTTKTPIGASKANQTYEEEYTWAKLNAEEPPSLAIEDVAGDYTLYSFYFATTTSEFYNSNINKISGSMTIDQEGNFLQIINLSDSTVNRQGEFITLNETTFLVNSETETQYFLPAHYDGKYLATHTFNNGQVEVNIWVKNQP